MTPRHTLHPEHYEQREFFRIMRELKRLGDSNAMLTVAVPNAARRSKHLSAYMKSEGLTPGIPDILLLAPNQEFCGLAIEMKIPPNESTQVQKEFQNNLKYAGWRVEECHTAVEAFNVWVEYTGISPNLVDYVNRKFCINGKGLFS